MKTFNRKPYEIDTTLKNINKYDNQLTFTGIKQSKNIYEVDQKSQMDTLNVYINDENTLVSREPLVEDTLDIELDGELIDIKETNGVKVYVVETETNYKIIAKRDNEIVELTAIEYHLAIFNQYIICFRTEGAQVIDTDNEELLWKDIDEFVEVPILKSTTGAVVEELQSNTNQLTSKYKEQYIIEENIRTMLPELNPKEVRIETKNETYELKNFYLPFELTEERLIRKCKGYYNNFSPIDITYHNNIVCISEEYSFKLSLDYGDNFVSVKYPFNYEDKVFPAQLSEDGRVVFVIVKKGVWICKIGEEYVWELMNIRNDENLSLSEYDEQNQEYTYRILLAKFVNSEMFLFVQVFDTDTLKPRLYFKGPNLYSALQHKDKLDYIKLDGLPNDVNTITNTSGPTDMFYGQRQGSIIKYDKIDDRTILAITCSNSSKQFVIFVTNNNNDSMIIKIQDYDKYNTRGSFTIYDSLISILDNYTKRFEIYGINNYVSDTNTYKYKITIVYDDDKFFEPVLYNYENLAYSGELIYINQRAFYGNVAAGIKVIFNSSNITFNERFELPVINNQNIDYYIAMSNSNTIYYLAGDTLLTNNLGNDLAIFIYEFDNNSDNLIKYKVPTLSYSSSELFLAFDNKLMISNNIKDGSNILFNIPIINNQSFVNNITNMLNISTTELAIFFEDNITICSKITNDNSIAYRFDKTRLSLGVRLGDDVINTLDGANSMFPTIRGLALMNYQAYMATTDQMLTFVSDNIVELWTEFYKKSNTIKMIQMRNYIYLSNNTDEYLMLDIRNMSWWKFKIPINVVKMLTDQIQLKIISSKLYKLDTAFDKNKYIDNDNNAINWYIISQRLHFGAINYYKNLKQLIFQLVQSNDYENTIDTEIKLYRKIVSYKEPDTIKFKVDEYRTFVKRFNYWKINELQWCLSNDNTTATPAQLILNGIDIKYEIGEEVR